MKTGQWSVSAAAIATPHSILRLSMDHKGGFVTIVTWKPVDH